MNFWKYVKHRGILLLIVLCVATCAAVSIIYAKYVTDQTTEPDVDIIAEGELQITVSGSTPNYTITNTTQSNMPAYVRFAVIVNWKNGDGDLWAIPPEEGEDEDYTITVDGCTKLGSYYYYNGMRAPEEGFPVVIAPTPQGEKPGYTLDVQILAEGIQCLPDNDEKSAVRSAWGVKYDGTTWVSVTP
jgi:hypothetical protein